MNQIEKLNRKLKQSLQGRTINEGRLTPKEMTVDELVLVEFFIKAKSSGVDLPLVSPISTRYYVDFIGWDNPKYNDVLISEAKGKAKPW